MYFKPVMPGTTYQITPFTMDASLPFIKYFATRYDTYHVARVQEPNLKEEGYIGTITVKFFSLSLSLLYEK